jgi:hypothetical protein
VGRDLRLQHSHALRLDLLGNCGDQRRNPRVKVCAKLLLD